MTARLKVRPLLVLYDKPCRPFSYIISKVSKQYCEYGKHQVLFVRLSFNNVFQSVINLLFFTSSRVGAIFTWFVGGMLLKFIIFIHPLETNF